jgi:hypothetical protein
MRHPAWIFIIVGLWVTGIGLIWLVAPSILWLGSLPGDIHVEQNGFHFYFPLKTCINTATLPAMKRPVVSPILHARTTQVKGHP